MTHRCMSINMNKETTERSSNKQNKKPLKMKAFLFLSSLLILFIPSFSLASAEEVSFERICREATTGDDYNFCVAALQGIPMNPTANIRELAVTAVEQLIANCARNVASLKYRTSGDVSPDFDFGKTFKCIGSIMEVAKDIQAAISKIQSMDIPGAIEELGKAAKAIGNCVGDSSSGGGSVSLPGEIGTILNVANVAFKIVGWLITIF